VVRPVLSPKRVGVTDAQAGLPAKRLRLRLPSPARCTRSQWLVETGCGSARCPIHGGASAAVFHRLPEPKFVHLDGPVRMRQISAFRSHGAANACARSSVAALMGERPETFIDTEASGGVDSRPFPGIRKGVGCVALHRRIGAALASRPPYAPFSHSGWALFVTSRSRCVGAALRN